MRTEKVEEKYIYVKHACRVAPIYKNRKTAQETPKSFLPLYVQVQIQ